MYAKGTGNTAGMVLLLSHWDQNISKSHLNFHASPLVNYQSFIKVKFEEISWKLPKVQLKESIPSIKPKFNYQSFVCLELEIVLTVLKIKRKKKLLSNFSLIEKTKGQ